MNRTTFYNSVRGSVNLTTQNVIGFEKVLDYGEKRGSKLAELAYVLATAFWESAQTMHPVKEAYWKSEAWRKANLRYFPWYGRGLIQTTWQANYKKMGDVIGVNLIKNPDALLDWPAALPALFIGMEKGLYTGRDLDDFIDNVDESDDEDLREFANARRIVNGTDKAIQIGKLALVFERGLKAASYVPGKPGQRLPDDPGPMAADDPLSPPATPAKPPALVVNVLVLIFLAVAAFGIWQWIN